MIHLGPGRETEVIQAILEGAAPGDLSVPVGDDATVLGDGRTVISTDLSMEDVHFRRVWLSPREIGFRAAMGALSDLAAMGATPTVVLASVAGTAADAADGTLAGLGLGIREAAESLGAALAGGDTTGSPGPLVADIVVLGITEAPVLRSGARPGDELWVTGTVGGAAAAVSLWEAGETPPPGLRERYARPRARIEAMQALRATGVLTGGLDLSDGLLRDGSHLCAASGVGVELDVASVPVDPAALEALGRERALEAALAGGEDYELLVSARPGLQDHVETIKARAGVDLTRVGRVVAGGEVRVLDRSGAEIQLGRTPFDHFSGHGQARP